ncbi:transcription initiation factor TFIIE alpha subunit [Coprinopsis cinerea okayama7|uniref:Transcription initiation factor TFIIE alpha subunit n=1 Tax=Coprinopsis cinerea (strain Okayama-7 / 130 / ATCC MYA-4618 / FGSC 9003) TaxID=240176 RepID=A8NBS5_COPC7|nr:transcription initiation factor TFIIE alpha subunit [Coprinopsis cinerea okayama7\|eukprot:XP_001832273.2 transcription initiation factor TFIIE alpha subunit [Coprinopsis cinerea okayama7\
MSTKEEQETLRLLVQHVSRAFYEPKYIIIMDQLARHPVLKDDDLAGRMGLQPKELNKVIAVLSNDCLVKVYRQNELKEGAQRSVGKQYYYIDYEHFCNVVKWRIAKMRHKIDHKLRNEIDNKGYICPQCKQSFTPLEADKLMDFSRGIFACDICHHELVDNENSASVQGSKDRMMRFNHQMRFIREGLQKSEAMKLPKFDVATWVKTHVAAEAAQRQQMNGGTDGASGGGSSAGHGLKVAGAGSSGRVDDGIGIVMVQEGDGEDEERRRKEREKEAEQKRVQNALPAWHLKSTITGDLTALGVKESARIAAAQAQTLLGDESLKGLGVIGASSSRSHQRSVSSSTSMTLNTGPADSNVDSKVDINVDVLDRYYASLAAASTPASSTVSVAPTPAPAVASEYGDEEEDRKPAIEYLDSLNDYRKRSRSAEDIGGGSKTPKIPKTESVPSFVEASITEESTAMDISYHPGDSGAGGDPIVYVNGEAKPLSQVTEADHELMTPEEYTAFYQILEENPHLQM